MKTHQNRHLKFEGLETRDLLSADFGVQMIETTNVAEVSSVVSCEMATVAGPSQLETTTEVEAPATLAVSELDRQNESLSDSSQSPIVLQSSETSDGQIPGFFGRLTSDNPDQSFQYEAPEDGVVQLAIAGQFEEGGTVEIHDQEGNLVSRSKIDNWNGFMELEFSAESGEVFDIKVLSQQPQDDPFMLTVDLIADPAPVDLHADQIGGESTSLDMECTSNHLEGEVGRDGDVDTFQFQATSDGKVQMELRSTGSDQGVRLKVIDGSGNLVTSGQTGSQIDFQPTVEEGKLYYVVVESSSAQQATYQLDLKMTRSEVPVPEAVSELESIKMEEGRFEVEKNLAENSGSKTLQLDVGSPGELIVTFQPDLATGSVSVTNQAGETIAQGLTSDALKLMLPVIEPQILNFEIRSPSGEALDFRLDGELNVALNPGNSRQGSNPFKRSISEFNQTSHDILDRAFFDPNFSDSLLS